MIRKLGGIAAGIAIAIAIMMIAEVIGHALFDVPIAADGASPASVQALPAEVQLSVLLGWFLGALIGGYASIAVSRFGWTAWAVAAVVLLAVLTYFLLSPMPGWMIAGGIIAPPLGGWLAQLLPRKTL